MSDSLTRSAISFLRSLEMKALPVSFMMPPDPSFAGQGGALQADESQFVLVVAQVQKPAARDGPELPQEFEIRFPLQLDRYDEPAAFAEAEPTGKPFVEPVGIADHVGEKPVRRSHMGRWCSRTGKSAQSL